MTVRIPPAKRAYSGLAGSPLARVTVPAYIPEPAPALAIIPTPAKRGRPPKNGVAMTQAQRKAASRANQKQKQENSERRTLITNLMKVYRRQQARIVFDPERPREWERAQITAAQQKRKYLDQLMSMTLTELMSLAQVQKAAPDSHGRLHNERSGEGPQQNGQSEMEVLVAVQQKRQFKELSAGYRVRPEGYSPNSFDPKDTTVDKADSPVRREAKPEYKPTAAEKWLDKTIDVLVSAMDFYGQDAVECPFCNEKLIVKQGAINHLNEQFAQGQRDLDRHRQYISGIAAMNTQLPEHVRMGVTLEPLSVAYRHYELICEAMAQVRKDKRKKPVRRKNFVTSVPEESKSGHVIDSITIYG